MSNQRTNPPSDSAPRRCVMVIEDDASFGKLLLLHLQRDGYEVQVMRSGEEALARMPDVDPNIILMDVMLPGKDGASLLSEIRPVHPDIPLIVMSAAGSIEVAVDCMKRGAYDFLSKPFDIEKLHTMLRQAFQYLELNARTQAPEPAQVSSRGFEEIIAHAANMRHVVDQARRASSVDADVLILGESGAGKELLSRAIHANSSRKKGPFVAINCGAIPETLLESELFGHEKGAFTGAINRRIGCFEQAHTGTLFLDEIGEMRPDMQVRLMRALENREIRRVGGDRVIKVDTRVISATNQDIAENLRTKRFRVDLYYRLAVLVLNLPPLRERPQDVALLAQHFLDEMRQSSHGQAARFSPQALDLMMRYQWPGNVRELRNAVARALVYEDSSEISAANLPQDILRAFSRLGSGMLPRPEIAPAADAAAHIPLPPQPGEAPPREGYAVASTPGTRRISAVYAGAAQAAGPVYEPPLFAGDDIRTLDEEEKRIILRTLQLTGGNISDAARKLGVHRSTLHRKMTRYGLATDDQLAAGVVKNTEA